MDGGGGWLSTDSAARLPRFIIHCPNPATPGAFQQAMQTGRWHEVDGPSSTQLRYAGRRAATTSTESRGVNGAGQRAAQASVEHSEHGRDISRPACPARHQSRYKTHPARPTRCQFRYKTRPTRPKSPNLARFALAGRVLSRFHRQQTTQGEFSPAQTPAPPQARKKQHPHTTHETTR